MSNTNVTRRTAVKAIGAAACAFNIVPRHVLGGPGYTPPSETLTRGVIGVGGMGSGHLKYKGSKILAVCDVNEGKVKRAVSTVGKDCTGYRDFRELITRPDIDIVSVVTPPHWHGLMAIAAAEAGKDVWCEKPVTRTIGEGKALVEACRRNGTILRVNTWFRLESNFYGLGTPVKQVKKLVDSGMLGWPLKVTVSSHTGFNWKISMWNGRFGNKTSEVPKGFDYDMWLGPAPERPFTTHHTGKSFRGYWDYDGGGLGDMGMHYLDPIQYFLGKDNTSPVRVEVDTDDQHPFVVQSWRKVRLIYDDGCEIILDGDNSMKDSAYIEGPEGKLFRGFKSDIPNLREKLASFPDPEPQLLDGGAIQDYHTCVRERRKFGLNEENAHRSTTLVNISKIALRLNRSLDFDPVKQEFINDDEANRYVNPPMRAPWNLSKGLI